MRRFWDERAREDAYYFVDTRLQYGRPDLDALWAGGERDLDVLLGGLGVAVTPADVVVEIGCGVGRLTRVLARRAAHVHAFDVSAEMLSRARAHHPHAANVDWRLGDGASLQPLPDGSADACVSHVVFQHIPDPAVTLGYVREMGRVLRPGGWAAFQVSTDPTPHRWPGARERAVARLTARARRGPRGRERPAWLGSAVSVDELHAAASAGGLDLERVELPGHQFCAVLARRSARGERAATP